MSAMPTVSVVIPTYRRPTLLLRCLRALAAQTQDASAFEIIVIDDGRDQATRQAVMRLAAEFPRLCLVYAEAQGTRGPAGARNRGWRLAQAPIIAFTDDDTIPAPDWLQAGLQVLATLPQAVAVAGAVQVPIGALPTDYEKNIKKLETAGFVTANCFVHRHALEEVGGFDERFTRAWREDTDLFLNLRRCGPVVFSTQPVVVHPVRAASWGESLRAHRNLLFDALLYKKHGRLYWRHVRSAPPWRYYLMVLTTLGAAAAAVAGAGTAAALLLGLWAGLTGAFTLQRWRGTSPRWRDRWEVLATSVAIPFVAVFWRLAGALRWRVPFL